ncbi:hypothetical protein J4221_04105 [Candidatus Pacearchaeota archaeon]|nr:hypothetical protein [Candidatus Pacearchaeota archaeon]
MDRIKAYSIFTDMIDVVQTEISSFVQNQSVSYETKEDKTIVTSLDTHLDGVLSEKARNEGFESVSEEGEAELEIVKKGNYITIDPIDGTLAFLEHFKLGNYKNSRLGESYDYSLLLGIVENGKPRFGCCYNYITEEKIFLDSQGDIHRECLGRKPFCPIYARYADVRANDTLNQKLAEDITIPNYSYRSFGLASVNAQLNEHDSFILAHFSQQNGLWDILPAAVLAQFSGAKMLNGYGNEIVYNDYLLVPRGVVLCKGKKFSWVEKALKPS